MKFENDQVVFSSGRRRYAFDGIFGIDERLYVTYGHDGAFFGLHEFDAGSAALHEPVTREDMIELADLMIERWTQFKMRCEQSSGCAGTIQREVERLHQALTKIRELCVSVGGFQAIVDICDEGLGHTSAQPASLGGASD